MKGRFERINGSTSGIYLQMNGIVPSDRADVVIIGGGVMGLLSALYLHAQGARPRVLERSLPGRAASWAGGGILSPLRPWQYPAAVSVLVKRSIALYSALADTFLRDSGIDIEMVQSGMLYLDAEVGAATAWAAQWGQVCEAIAPEAVPTIETGVAAQEVAVFFPHTQQIRNPRLLRALIESLGEVGVPITSHATTRLHLRGARIAFVVDGDTPDFAPNYLVAAGAWTSKALSAVGGFAVRPVRGQMLCVKAEPGVLKRIVMKRDRYLIPRRDGRILVGSTLEEVGFELATTAAARDELWRAAVEILPDLSEYPVEAHWAGLRPGSPTSIPYIGRHPEFENLWLCTGHYRNGLAMAPASAELVGDLILGKVPVVDPLPYAVARA